MATKCKIDYLMFKVRGRLVKVDADIYYKIFSTRHEPPYRKYNGDIKTIQIASEGYPVIIVGDKPPQRHLRLSRFVMNAKEGQLVDHRNRDPLDNRRENLRIVTKRQNNLNKKCKNGTGFIGVCLKNRKCGKYCQATYQLSGGKQLSFQLPDSPHNRIVAAMARDKFVLQQQEEEYAPLNFPCFKNEPFRSYLLQEDLRSRAEKPRRRHRQNNENKL